MGVFRVFQRLFLLKVELDAQFLLRAGKGGENELVALHRTALEDGDGIKGRRNVRAGSYVSYGHVGRMVQDVADDKFLLHPAQENDGMVESTAFQVGSGHQQMPG